MIKKDCDIYKDIPVGTIFRMISEFAKVEGSEIAVKDNLMISTNYSSTKYITNIDKGRLYGSGINNLDKGNTFDIDIVRLGLKSELLMDKNITVRIDLRTNEKLKVVKTIKMITKMGLKECKDVVDDAYSKGETWFDFDTTMNHYKQNVLEEHNKHILEIL